MGDVRYGSHTAADLVEAAMQLLGPGCHAAPVITRCVKCSKGLKKLMPQPGAETVFYDYQSWGMRGVLYMKVCEHCRIAYHLEECELMATCGKAEGV